MLVWATDGAHAGRKAGAMDDDDAATTTLGQSRVGAIERIDLILARLPFRTAFETSLSTRTHKEVLLLRILAGGVEAWGECVADPDPYYDSETIASARHVITQFLLPRIEPDATVADVVRTFRHVRGHKMARATVENALADLVAKRLELPLHAVLGSPARPIPSGIAIGLYESPQALVEAVSEAASAGYHRVKIKIKRGKDLPFVEAVRERFPAIRLMVDANGDYTLEDTEHLRRLDQLGLMMIEQPLGHGDIYQHSILQQALRTPLCLDESIHCLEDAAAAIDLAACRIVNLKQGRVGGLLEALRIARYCVKRGVPVWSGGMLETGIGRAVNIHLQTAPAFTLPGDTSETRRYFDEDIVEPPVLLDRDGFIAVPPGRGIGVAVVTERLVKRALHWERIR